MKTKDFLAYTYHDNQNKLSTLSKGTDETNAKDIKFLVAQTVNMAIQQINENFTNNLK